MTHPRVPLVTGHVAGKSAGTLPVLFQVRSADVVNAEAEFNQHKLSVLKDRDALKWANAFFFFVWKSLPFGWL